MPGDMYNCRFFTLTIDPTPFVVDGLIDGAGAYQAGKDRLKRFMRYFSNNLKVYKIQCG